MRLPALTLDAQPAAVRFGSIGIAAADLSMYRHTISDEGDRLVYEEEGEPAWIQSTCWLQAESMC